MHQVGNFVQFTLLKEEPSIIDRLVRAVATRRLTPFHVTTFAYVYHYMILENRDLSLLTFNNFRTCLSQLDIPLPYLHVRMDQEKYRGSRPRIPDQKKANDKFMVFMDKRAKKRSQAFEESLIKFDMTRARFEELIRGETVTATIKEEVSKVTSHIDSKFLEIIKLMGIDQNDPRAAEVKRNLRLVVDNT